MDRLDDDDDDLDGLDDLFDHDDDADDDEDLVEVTRYDPDVAPPARAWLDTDEGLRIELVVAYHRRERIALPNVRLHAVIHVVVENQLAMGEVVVQETHERLQAEGLSRHDAIHAIGTVLAERFAEVLQRKATGEDLTTSYLDGLKVLTAKGWNPNL